MLPYDIYIAVDITSLAFYGADVLLCLFRYSIKAVTLTAQDTHMTLIQALFDKILTPRRWSR
jgi:hypothetical protein